MLNEEVNPPLFKQGTKISIAFEQKDYEKLLSSLSLYLTYTKNNYEFLNKEILSKLKIGTDCYTHYGSNWALKLVNYSTQYKAYLAIIEGIPYKIDLKLLSEFVSNSKSNLDYILNKYRPHYIKEDENKHLFGVFLGVLTYYSFEIKLNIGTVDLSASRESLQYTDKTSIHLYTELYKMFIEFFRFLDIDCVHNPDIFDAAKNFYNYPSTFVNLFSKNLHWYKHNLFFHQSETMYQANVEIPEDIKMYKMDNVYSSKENRYVDVLKNTHFHKVYLSEKKYIICIQDSKYTNYAKYVKYYINTNIAKDKKFITVIVCLKESDLKCLKSWFKDVCSFIKVSDLIETYNKECPQQKVERISKELFKTFELVDFQNRPRCNHIFQYTKEVTAYKQPSYKCYYLSVEELEKTSIFVKVVTYNIWKSFTTNLFNYFKHKNFEGNIFICEKATKNYSDKNWINLLDVIRKDCDTFNINIDNFSGKKYKEIGLSIFRYNLIKNHYSIFNTLSKHKLENNSYYFYIQNLYNKSEEYILKNDLLYCLIMLIDIDLYRMQQILTRSHFYSFESFKCPEYIEKLCNDFFIMCNEYLDKLPFLKTFNITKRSFNDLDLKNEDYSLYITLMEKELSLYKRIDSDLDLQARNNKISEFNILYKRLMG